MVDGVQRIREFKTTDGDVYRWVRTAHGRAFTVANFYLNGVGIDDSAGREMMAIHRLRVSF